jgi:hypothetical protein
MIDRLAFVSRFLTVQPLGNSAASRQALKEGMKKFYDPRDLDDSYDISEAHARSVKFPDSVPDSSSLHRRSCGCD